jgi:curved DNA-binding protein CbpA
MKPLNFYEILEIARDATPEQIKLAFRRLARRWHPDRHADGVAKREATRQMQQVNAAHDTLKDADKREKYDASLDRPLIFRAPVASTEPRPAPRRRTAKSNPWQRAAPRPEPAPRETPPPVQNFPNPAQEAASAARFERATHAVRVHFDNLIRRYPDQKAKLAATLKWQLTKQSAAVRLGREKNQSEAASLARWVQNAKRALENRVETPPFAPRDPNRPQPVTPPISVLDEEIVASVKAYFESLMQQHPLDKGPLRAALDWQLIRKKTEITRLIRAGQSESVALTHWAEQARLAADKQIKKRK